MPRTVDEGFRDFLQKLTPSNYESDAAKLHRVSIKQCLESNFGLQRFWRIGSFGNGTSISGYSDVDYMASIPTEKLKKNSSTSLTAVRNALATRFPNTSVRTSCPAVCCPLWDRCEGNHRDNTRRLPFGLRRVLRFTTFRIVQMAGWRQVPMSITHTCV